MVYAIPTRDPSARQLTTGHCPAVPTRASQSDQLSLPSRRPPDPSTPTTMTTNNKNNRPLDTGIHLRPVVGCVQAGRVSSLRRWYYIAKDEALALDDLAGLARDRLGENRPSMDKSVELAVLATGVNAWG